MANTNSVSTPIINMRQIISLLLAFSMTVPLVASAQDAAPAEPKYWTTQWAFDDVDVNQLADRLESIGIETGLDLQGTVSVEFEVGIPLTSLGDAAAYRFEGSLTSPSLVVDGVMLRDLRTTVVYRDGVATLENLSSEVIDRQQPDQSTGSIQGNASAQLIPKESVSGKVIVKDLAVAPLAELIAKMLGQTKDQLPSDGKFSGSAEFTVPLESASEVATYQLDGEFSGRGLRVANLPPADFDAKRVRIEDQRLLVDKFSLTAEPAGRSSNPIRLFGKASLPLSANGDFRFEVFGDDVPLGNIAAADQLGDPGSSDWMTGKLDFRIIGEGQIDDTMAGSKWNIHGSIASPSLVVAGIALGTLEHEVELTPTMFNITPKRELDALPKSFRLGELRSQYTINDETLVIENLDATLFGGTVSGSATIPLVDTAIAIANVTVDGIRPQFQWVVSGRTTRVSSALTGELDWRVPMNAVGQPAQHDGQAELLATEIMIGEQNIGDMRVIASADAGKISLNAIGTVFDGRITCQTVADMLTTDLWSDLPSRLAKTSFQFEEMSVERLNKTILASTIDVRGFVSGELTVVDWNRGKDSKASLPEVDVSLELSRMSHRSRVFSRSVSLKGKLSNDIFEVASLVGDYADGSVRARGRVYVIDQSGALHPRVDLRVSANRVDLARSLWFLGDVADDFEGRVSASVTVAGYQESIRARGSCDATEVVLYGLPVGKAHSSLAADANVGRKSWKVRFPSVRSNQGGGQLKGELSLASSRTGGSGVDLASRWLTRRVDFFRLSRKIGQSSSLARGEITGDLTLSGKSIRGLDDLNGRFNFALGQTRGAAIPGLMGVSRFLGPISLVNQTFDVGEVKGLIGRGAITVDEFWLGSDSALVQADGKIFIRSGRMDLNALIATGDYGDIATNFAQLAQEYALRSLLPASLILDISELLLDRTLVVRVMGTLQDPIIRLQPVQTFREEAARFLLREGKRLIVAGVSAGAAEGIFSR